jgi:hypothetical protein
MFCNTLDTGGEFSNTPENGVHYVEKGQSRRWLGIKQSQNLKGDWPIWELRNIFVGIDLGDKNSVARIAVDRGKIWELRNIFVGIDLGDKNSVARIAVDRGKAERYGFVNNAPGRARLCEEVKRRAGAGNGQGMDGLGSLGMWVCVSR